MKAYIKTRRAQERTARALRRYEDKARRDEYERYVENLRIGRKTI